MLVKHLLVGVLGASLVISAVVFTMSNKTIEKVSNEEIKVEKTAKKVVSQPKKVEKKYDLYSETPYDLPLFSIVEISKLPSSLKKEIDNLLEQSQGFYYLKKDNENRVFIILQNPITQANTYQRHNLEFVELSLNNDGSINKNIYPISFAGIDGEINNAIDDANSKPDIWKFDKAIEPYRPLKHSFYDEKGKLKFTELWNYSENDNVKYQMKNSKNKLISILKEITDNDTNYRKEHIFYSDDGTVEMSLSANYDGANVSRFTYYNLLNNEDSVIIISEFDENGNKTKESIYSNDYQLLKIIKVELENNVRKEISVYDNEHKLLDKISA